MIRGIRSGLCVRVVVYKWGSEEVRIVSRKPQAYSLCKKSVDLVLQFREPDPTNTSGC